MNTKKKTKIVATIGPASESAAVLEKMSRNGLNVARLNFSHDTHETHAEKIKTIRAVVKKTGKRIAILQDLSGPKIRTGEVAGEWLHLKKGKKITLTTKKQLATDDVLFINYKQLPQDVQVGHRVLLNDGKQELRVLSKTSTEVVCKIIYGGKIRSRRGVNLPDSSLSVPALTAKDKKDLAFGLKHNVDFVALSFVQSAADIKRAKQIIKKAGSVAMVIAKIETPDALKNIEAIIEESDGIMVARGDLAVEIGPALVPMAQKEIIKICNEQGKPVIVATQMLETMVHNSVPTRAEVSDVANAILDGADAVMLSEETAMGNDPVLVVKTMKDIALATEEKINYKNRVKREYAYSKRTKIHATDAVTRYAAKTAFDVHAAAIVALTETGTTPRMVARYRIDQPIVVVSSDETILNQSLITFGAYPGQPAKLRSREEMLQFARKQVRERGLAKAGDTIVIVSGSIYGKAGETNTMTVINV